MVIDRNCWHARLYRWWLAQKDRMEYDSVNLCPYVRAVLFWAPLRFLFLQKVMRWISWPLLAAGVELLLWRTWGIVPFQVELMFLVVVLGASVIICIGAGIWWTLGKTREAEPVRSFGRVLAHRVHSAHKGICPVVHIR